MLSVAGAAGSTAGRMMRATGAAIPTSFNGDDRLYAVNLFLTTAFMCLGAMMAAKMARAVWANRRADRTLHPVTLWRSAWFCAGTAAFLRCGSEAMNLWAWNPADPETTARVLMAKRWVDPAALLLAAGWMGLVLLCNAAMEEHLRRAPFPVNMWASLPQLRRPAAIVLLSLAAAVGVAATR